MSHIAILAAVRKISTIHCQVKHLLPTLENGNLASNRSVYRFVQLEKFQKAVVLDNTHVPSLLQKYKYTEVIYNDYYAYNSLMHPYSPRYSSRELWLCYKKEACCFRVVSVAERVGSWPGDMLGIIIQAIFKTVVLKDFCHCSRTSLIKSQCPNGSLAKGITW